MKKPIILFTLLVVLLSVGTANALVYDYNKESRYVAEGNEYEFLFDLVARNRRAVTKSISLQNDDTAVGWDNVPFLSSFLNLGLSSLGMDLQPIGAEPFKPVLLQDALDVLGITPPIGCDDCLPGDFRIPQIGMGGQMGPGENTAPVPEPATMILLGTGLIGLAGARRRKKIKK